ncbi:ABC transporter permease subunit [Herbidospora sp. NEAU-GS84]|uniref:ABC transporter permease subunit n=1 Tax=Herbidospora solisilvae TaxID=2696284 RepID=A0A7C9J684_9ACTN|nr:carbohydrate ABC transporter permease [Herbidospora solisilvae]NAS24940.1 ABC transporter permease subunit [Herbidospora solisilvae]
MKTETAPAVPQVRREVRPTAGKKSAGLLGGVSHLMLVLWTILTVTPIVYTFLNSFKTNTEIFGDSPLALPRQWGWGAWGRAWETSRIGEYLVNTVIVVAFSTFFTMLLGSMAAYVLSRYDFRGNRLIYTLFVAGLSIPPFLALSALYKVVDNVGLLGTHTGVVLVYVAYSLPFTVFFLAAFFKTLPTTVAEAAMMDGCGHARTFFQIMLPMARPGLISITIFNVIGQWNQYLLPIALLPGDKQDKWLITQGIANISTSAGYEADWAGLFAALSMAIIPILIVYVIFQRQIQTGLTAGVGK